MKEKVVQAVLHLLSAETLYKNLCIPIRNRAIIAKLYQFPMNFSIWLNLPTPEQSYPMMLYE
jgi:hypothetical protein